MQEVMISLNSIEEVKEFVHTITMFDGDFELISGKYIVDAKSILGLEYKAVAKQNPDEYEPWQKALVGVMGQN